MSKDFIHNNILQGVADAIRYCDDTTAGIAPVDYASRIRALDKLIPQPDALNFYMPNGGTISLNKTGTPTVVELEYSLDRGATWTVWAEDQDGNRSLTLTAGQRMYIRNTSTSSTKFSTSTSDYYRFHFDGDVYASGSVMSLLCKNEIYDITCTYCFYNLFYNCTTLRTAADLTATKIEARCYHNIYYGCSSLVTPPIVAATTYGTFGTQAYHFYSAFAYCTSMESAPILRLPYAGPSTYYRTFYGCTNLKKVVTYMTSLDSNSLYSWLSGVAATGDFYCPAELTIPTGNSGIPSGWTRHDI